MAEDGGRDGETTAVRRSDRRVLRIVLAVLLLATGALAWWLVDRSSPYAMGEAALARKDYPAAVAALAEAVRLNPDRVEARVALAHAYRGQYVPGGSTPENLQIGDRARQAWTAVLDRQPEDGDALAALGYLDLAAGALDDARRWATRLIDLQPAGSDGYYLLASIERERVFGPYVEARSAAGMTLEAPGPIAAPQVRARWRGDWMAPVDAAIVNARRACELDPQRTDALTLLSGLARLRADMAESDREFDDHMRVAAQAAEQLSAARVRASRPDTTGGAAR